MSFLRGLCSRYDLSNLVDEDRKVVFFSDDDLVYTLKLNVEENGK